jgi:hypothetical protein
MTTAELSNTPEGPRWGEGLVLTAALPGAVADVVLGIGLTFEYLGWQPNLGPLLYPFVWAAIFSPLLAFDGTLTLVAGVLVAPFVPGRPAYKWGILLVGTIAWGAAFYWLSVPGLIDLP